MRTFSLGAILTLAFISFAAAADDQKLLIGTWKVVKAQSGAVLNVGATMQFMPNGTLNVVIQREGIDVPLSGTYTVSGDKFSYKVSAGGEEHHSTITIKNISQTELDTINSESEKVMFTRVK